MSDYQFHYQSSSQTGLTIRVGNVEVDIFHAQKIIARLLRGLQKIKLLRQSRAFSRWKNWEQYQRIKDKTDVMVATKQLEFFVSTSLQEVRDMVGCDRATFFMVDLDSRDLWSSKADGHRESFRVPRGVGVAGSTVESKTPSNVHDAYRDPRFNSTFDKISGYHTKTILCYPVFEFQEAVEEKEEHVSSKTVMACVQLVNKHSGLFTRGDEDTCETLCNFLSRAMSMEDSHVDFGAVRLEFDDWSIVQRKQLMTDRTYGSTIEVFLEQACLLTGAAGSRFILKQRQQKGINSHKRGSFHEWHGTCQFSSHVSNKTVMQSIKRALNGKESFALHDHIEGFEFNNETNQTEKRLDSVIVIPLFLKLEEDGTKSGLSPMARFKAAAKRSTLERGRCICVLEYEKKKIGMDDINAYVKTISKTVSILFDKFGSSLFNRMFQSNEYDGSAMAKLADIRGWVRNQMHKQSQDKFEKTTLRKYQTLTRTADTLQKQNVELRRQLERTKALLAKSENECTTQSTEAENMKIQRDLMAEQMVALTPDTPQIDASELERQTKAFKMELQQHVKQIRHLQQQQIEKKKECDTISKALEAAVVSITDLEDQKKIDHSKLMNAKKNKNSSEKQLRSYLDFIRRKLDAVGQASIFTEDGSAKMVEVADLREKFVQMLSVVMTHKGVKSEQFKTLVHELSVKLLSAEAQLAFLPKCQKMLTESKRTLATMQIKEQARARKREEGPLEVAVAVRHYNRKFISTWRTWVRNKVHAEAQRCQRSLQGATCLSMQRNSQRRSFRQWDCFTGQQITLKTNMNKAVFFLRNSYLKRTWRQWCASVNNQISNRFKLKKAVHYFGRKSLSHGMNAIKSFSNRRQLCRALVKRIAIKQYRSKLTTAFTRLLRQCAENDNYNVYSILFRRRTLTVRFSQWYHKIERLRKDKRLLKRALTRIIHRRLVYRWHLWEKYVGERQRQRKRVLHIFTNMNRRKYGKAWRQWVTCMEALEREKAQARNIMRRWLQRSLHLSFNQWVHYLEDMKKARHFLHRILTRWDRKQETNAIRTWALFAMRKRKQAVVAQRVLSRWLQESNLRMFVTWRTNANQWKTERLLVHRAMSRFTRKHLHSHFHDWCRQAKQWKVERQLVHRALSRFTKKHLSSCFHTWYTNIEQWKVERQLVHRALSRFTKKHMSSCFHTWHTKADKWRSERQLVHRALSRFTKNCTARCFHGWKYTVENLIFARELLCRILTRWDRKQEANALRQWSYFAAMQTKQDNVVHRILKRWLGDSLHRAFNRWATGTQERKIQRQLTQRVVHRISNLKMTACFEGWKHAVGRLGQERRIARKALSRFIHQSLSRCYTYWHTVTKDLKSARHKVRRILVRWDRKSEVKAFRMWSHSVRLAARQEYIMEKILYRWNSGLLHRSFNRWNTEAQSRKHDRNLIKKARNKCTKHHLSTTFDSWKLKVRDLKNGRMLLKRILSRWDHLREVQAFRKLQAFSYICARQENIAQRIKWRWSHILLLSAFNKWFDNARQNMIHRLLLQRAVHKRQKKTINTCFDAWEHVTSTSFKRRKLIIRAVLRYDKKCIGVGFTTWKKRTDAWEKRQNALYLCSVHKFESRLKRLALAKWVLMDKMKVWGYQINIVSCAKLRCSRILRKTFMAWSKHLRSLKRFASKMKLLTLKSNKYFRKRCLVVGVRIWKKYASMRARIKVRLKNVLVQVVHATTRRLQSKAWQTWKISVCGRQATQEYVAEYILCTSMEHRRKTALLKSCWCTWRSASTLSKHKKNTAKQTFFHHWNVYVRRCLDVRHDKLIDRFHKAGLRGSQAEIQWALGKWQQFAFCIQIRHVAELERKIFLKSIRGENKKLRQMLLEYHKRGMFVLDGSKDYLVQRKIQPALTLDSYDTIGTMIAESYHSDVPAGVKIQTSITSAVAFGRKMNRNSPTIPAMLLTPPKRYSPKHNISSEEIIAAYKEEKADEGHKGSGF